MNKEYSKVASIVVVRIHLVPLLIAICGLVIIHGVYPSFIKNNMVIALLIISSIVLIISCLKTYASTVEDLKSNDFIREQKKTENALETMLTGMNHYEKYVEEYKMKIEIHKAITPIPILIFILGIIIQLDIGDLIVVWSELINFQFNLDYVLGVILVFSGIWYMFSYKNCWEKYKFSLKRYYLYKNEYEVLTLKIALN